MTARRRSLPFSILLLAALALWTPSFRADEHNGCASVNNTSNNRISVFEIVGETGQLKWVQEVPTGGVGRDGGYFSIPQIVSARPSGGRACVFAANAATNDVSAFEVTIEHEPGTVCPCQHRAAGGATPVPVGTGGVFGPRGGGLALTPDGSTLYSANPGSSSLSAFAVERGCGLSRVGSPVPTPGPAADIQIRSDGRCLAVSVPETDRVATYRIGPERDLASAGRYHVPGPGRASGIEFSQPDLVRSALYVAKADPDEVVIVRYHLLADCRLAEEPAVVRTDRGRGANVVKLDPENRCLYVPNQRSASVSLLAANHPPSRLTSFRVEPATGDLTFVDSVDDVSFLPAGLAFGRTLDGESFLYYTSFSREILRRPVVGCRPGPVVEPGVRTGIPGTGLLRGLTIIQ